jgi:hypothetical protein
MKVGGHRFKTLNLLKEYYLAKGIYLNLALSNKHILKALNALQFEMCLCSPWNSEIQESARFWVQHGNVFNNSDIM